MAEDFPDLHHKLCKKLAHLTTGFYHLNIKSDENNATIQSIIESYENEIDSIVQTANTILEEQIASNPQHKEVHEIHQAYQEFKQKFEQERSASVEEFHNYKKRMEEEEQRRTLQFQEKVDNYQKEVVDLNEKMMYMKKVVEKSLGKEFPLEDEEKKAREEEIRRAQEEIRSKEGEISDWRKKYSELEWTFRNLQELVVTSHKRLQNGLSQEILDQEGESNPDLKDDEWGMGKLRRMLSDQENMIIAFRNNFGQKDRVEEASSIELGGNEEVLLLRKQEETNRLLFEREGEIERLKDKLKEFSDDDRLEKQMEMYENKLKEVNRECKKIIEIVHAECNENISEMEGMFENEKRNWEAKLQDAQNALEMRNEYIQGLEEKITTLELLKGRLDFEVQQKEEMQRRNVPLNQEIERLTSLLEEAKTKSAEKQQEIKNVIEAKESTLKDLTVVRRELVSAGELIEDLRAQIKQLESQAGPTAAEITEEYQNKFNDLSHRHHVEVKDMVTKHEEKVTGLEKKYEKEIIELKKELEKGKDNSSKLEERANELKQLKKEHENKLNGLSKNYDQQLQERVAEYKEKLKAKDDNVLNLQREIKEIRDQLKSESRKRREMEQKYKEFERTSADSKQTAVIDGLDSPQSGSDPLFERENSIKFGDKSKDELIQEHTKFVQVVRDKIKSIQRKYQEKIDLLVEQNNDLLKAFHQNSQMAHLIFGRQIQQPSPDTDTTRKLSEASKTRNTDMIRKDTKTSKTYNNLNVMNSIFSDQNLRKNGLTMSPSNSTTTSTLPPISINQLTMQVRSPPVKNGATVNRKFFK